MSIRFYGTVAGWKPLLNKKHGKHSKDSRAGEKWISGLISQTLGAEQMQCLFKISVTEKTGKKPSRKKMKM